MRIDNRQKDKINILLNIDNYFGSHTGRMAPMIIFLLVAAAPFILYVFILSTVIPISWAIGFEVLWAARMALLILGKEKEKLAVYKKTREDEFASVYDIVRVSHIHEDGLIEYMNGKVAYIVSGYTSTYFDDDEFCSRYEEFLHQIRDFEFDVHKHMVVDEFRLQDNLAPLNVYDDKTVMKERMNFYIYQDEYARSNTKLFRYNFLIKVSKYDWKKLRDQLSDIIRSSPARVFKSIEICDKQQVSDVFSRDVCAFIDIAALLQGKYKNEEFYGSEVLYYGNNVPEEFIEKPEDVGMGKRRQSEFDE